MKGLLLDTHVWLWVQRGNTAKISQAFLGEVERHQAEGTAFVSAVSVLELARMVYWDGYDLQSSVESFVDVGTANDGLRLLALSPLVLIESVRLPDDMHRDPSDRMLVATARVYGLALVTVDKQILRYAAAGHLSARKP